MDGKMGADDRREMIFKDISIKRKWQDEKFGEQNHHPLMWFSIIGEEFGEMCAAFNDYSLTEDTEYLEKMEEEVIDVAASCVAMIECLNRVRDRRLKPET
jgi:NTP pyrophosphatase (non-canonical NTP hydrolase)